MVFLIRDVSRVPIKRWIDINPKSRTVTCQPEKGGKPRGVRISEKLIDMFRSLPRRNQLVFVGTNLLGHRGDFRNQRKRYWLESCRIQAGGGSLPHMRHWKVTVGQHKTKDILHVKEMLEHRSIESTMKYIHWSSWSSTHPLHYPGSTES